MTYSCFEYELKDHVAHISMCRGDAFNSMTKAFWSELPELVDKISDEGKARVIVLSAQGKHFCAGMDLANFKSDGDFLSTDTKKITQGRRSEAQFRVTRDLQYSISCLEKSRIPVIAAIQGACIGAGVDLITACDIRYASSDAFFCIQEINIGMAADVGTLQRLPYLIPEGILRELAFTGRRFSADESLKYGLVNAVFDTPDAVIEQALAVAREIADKAPLAISGIKEVLNYNRDHTVEESLNYNALWNAAMNFSDDMMEAFKSKTEKRDPDFQDLVKKGKYLED
jgi:enoyl-CoA hydratase